MSNLWVGKVNQEAAFLGFSAAWASLRHVPEKHAKKFFEKAADRSYRKNGPAVRQYRKNLSRVVDPDVLESTVFEGMRSYARYWCEVFQMDSWSRSRILDIDVNNLNFVDEVRSGGKAPVCVATHSGNYDQSAAYVALKYGKLSSVAEKLKPYKLFDKFTRQREQYGMEILPTGQRDVIDVLSRRVLENTIVAFTSERDLSGRGVEVSFFGEVTKMPAGPALISWNTKTSIIPVSFYYKSSLKPGCDLFEPIEPRFGLDKDDFVRETTQLWASGVERAVREHPKDWHMLQKLWLSDLSF